MSFLSVLLNYRLEYFKKEKQRSLSRFVCVCVCLYIYVCVGREPDAAGRATAATREPVKRRGEEKGQLCVMS